MINVESDDEGLVDGWVDGYVWDYEKGEFVEYDGRYGPAIVDGFDPWEGEDINRNNINDAGEPSPIKSDTDNDGLWDGNDIIINGELKRGELTIHDFTQQEEPTLQLDPDSDDDGLLDGQEVYGWIIKYYDRDGKEKEPRVYSNPLDRNGDEDDLLDITEYTFTNALSEDTDGDGLLDSIEDENKNAIIDAGETSPLDADSDDDRLLDGNIFVAKYPGEDRDNDGIVDADEPDPLDSDSDNDFVIDGTEYRYLINLGYTDGYRDSDGDGLIDLKDKDSDNDGLYDGEENYNLDDIMDYVIINNVKYYREANATDPDSDAYRNQPTAIPNQPPLS